MRLGIISDTHGDKAAIRQAVMMAPPVDCWIHAGDHGQDGAFLEQLTAGPVYAVCGNTDLLEGREKPDEYIDIANKRIWVTHGHRYHVKNGLHELLYWANQFAADIIVFGHTHEPLVERRDGKLFINPGSAARPRAGSAASFVILTLTEEGEESVQLCRLDRKECSLYHI